MECRGEGLSVWDMFTRGGDHIRERQSGREACDHFHRYEEDVALFSQIGLKAYRFSISWPRVIPGGVGSVNKKGLDFYDRLVDNLLEAGIEPWVTLFHWTIPMSSSCAGDGSIAKAPGGLRTMSAWLCSDCRIASPTGSRFPIRNASLAWLCHWRTRSRSAS